MPKLMPTEQTPFFAGKEAAQEIQPKPQKGALNLPKIQHHNGHGQHMGNGLPQLGGHQSYAAFAFGQAEPALHLYPLTFIPVVLGSVPLLFLSGTPQGRAGEVDAPLLAIVEIAPVPVELVCQDAFRIMAFPFPEPLHDLLQIASLVIGIKGAVFQSCPAVHHTDIQLSSKFHRLARFPPHDGTNKRLAHTDDAVRNAVRRIVQCVNQLFRILPGLVQQRYILGIPDVGQGAGGVHDQAPAVPALVIVLLALSGLGVTEEHFVNLSQYLRRQPLTEIHHQRWVKRRL